MGANELADIDAVVTWVDGADPAHQQKLSAYLSRTGSVRGGSAHTTRFNDAGELDYCLASLLRFAPWLRRIHVVTDMQVPRQLPRLADSAYADRVRLVDHREIFSGFEEFLPTFNSESISSVLWRIPGLAEQFLYINDDMMLLRPVREADFFRDGKMVVRGKWLPQSEYDWKRRVAGWWKRLTGTVSARHSNLATQQAGARLAGFDRRYYRLYHNPYPMRRSLLKDYFEKNPEKLTGNISHRLRSPTQFNSESLSIHLGIAHEAALLDNALYTVQLKPRDQSSLRLWHKMARADADPRAAFVVVQSLELASPEVQARIVAWLDRRVGHLEDVLSGATSPAQTLAGQ
ncbi:capsular biosynthesis protein [Pseudoxanthomonas yeongjuensis]|uniref:stealth family protein n=1 Tax=Pseudoxanthomonas yeongjuensis TaxID=377616 RepID=UPI001390D01F|nr:stealth family protein [Pseudoxanthomonas yeongjuensis]KAF1716438.1 capsular biosynthesis protein [Pseudoxanthomonas yeongjuensis]